MPGRRDENPAALHLRMSIRRNYSPYHLLRQVSLPPCPISRKYLPKSLLPWSHHLLPDPTQTEHSVQQKGRTGWSSESRVSSSATQEVAWLPGYNQGPWRTSPGNITREIYFNAKICLKAVNSIQLCDVFMERSCPESHTNLTGKPVFQVNQCIGS